MGELAGRKLDAEVAEKYCNGCEQDLSISEFNKCSRSKDGLNWRCRTCSRRTANAYANSDKGRTKKKAWHNENKERMAIVKKAYNYNHSPRFKAWRRRWHLWKAYGITQSLYDQMLSDQDGKCAICLAPPKNERPLAVDHCHATGLVRGLLCDSCNTAIAHLQDSSVLVNRAAKYLEVHEKRSVA